MLNINSRKAFEESFTQGNIACRSIGMNPNGTYVLMNTQLAWQSWQACAAVYTKAHVEALQAVKPALEHATTEGNVQLWGCDQSTGREYLMKTGPRQAMQNEADALCEEGRDCFVLPKVETTVPPAAEPPLIGRWHHGQGYLVSGTIRISRWDCDTNPPIKFRDELLDWMCDTLNAAVNAHDAKRNLALKNKA